MSRQNLSDGEFILVLRVIYAVAALAALALLAPGGWRGQFARVPKGAGREGRQ